MRIWKTTTTTRTTTVNGAAVEGAPAISTRTTTVTSTNKNGWQTITTTSTKEVKDKSSRKARDNKKIKAPLANNQLHVATATDNNLEINQSNRTSDLISKVSLNYWVTPIIAFI